MLDLENIKKDGFVSIEESDKAYYIWPKPSNGYLSYLYRFDKETETLQELFIMDCLDDYPDFMERFQEVEPDVIFG